MNCFEHIVKALTHEIRPFLTLVLVFVTNKIANAEMPWLQNLPRDIFTKLSVENREMSNIGTMFNFDITFVLIAPYRLTVYIIIIYENLHMS